MICRLKRRFCKYGHDTSIKGRTPTGNCRVCLSKRSHSSLRNYVLQQYRHMVARINGRHTKSPEIWMGLPICKKEDYLTWAFSQPCLYKLWESFKDSNWKRSLAPSINRIDSTQGYVFGNMEFITLSENSRLGGFNGRKSPHKPYIRRRRTA